MLRRFVAPPVVAGAASLAYAFKHRLVQAQVQPTDAQVKHLLAAQAEYPIDPVCRYTNAPNVPPPITRNYPAKVVVHLTSEETIMNLGRGDRYKFWTFNKGCPGPFIRTRVGDIFELHYTNNDESGNAHNIDFHAISGPGGGAPLLLAEPGETKVVRCKMLYPGLYFYHCGSAPIPVHVANGMYGLILVEPEGGLMPVDKEYYVMQSEFYPQSCDDPDDPTLHECSYMDGLAEQAKYVVFNGREGALTDKPLLCNQGERVRLYVGNGGPNLVSSFHVIGWIFDKVYKEGDLISPPARCLQTTLIPAGGSCVVEGDVIVPGNLTLVDHSIFRIDKGCVGFLKVQGNVQRPDIYTGDAPPLNCVGCKVHN